MSQNNLLSYLKFKYRVLSNLVGMLSIFPAMISMFLWVPVLEDIQNVYSKGLAFLMFTTVFLMQAALNYLAVYFTYRAVLRRFMQLTNEEYWRLSWCQWYPEHWFK